MRNYSHLTLLVTGAVALLGAAGCSSPAEGDDGNTVVPFGNQGTGGTTGIPNVNGQGGTTGIPNVGTGGSSTGEGQAGSTFIPGQGGSANGTAGAGPVVEDTGPRETPGGYFVSGPWRGYAWSGDDELGIGTTRTPLDFSALTPNSPFCLQGSVGPDPNDPGTMTGGYEGVALLGFNINQEQFGPVEGQEAPLGTVVPTSTGVAVRFTNSMGSTLRIQLQGPNGETDASQRWCAELTTALSPAHIPYEDFVTNCWVGGTPQTPYNRTPLSAVVMTVPGDDATPVPYNICVAGFADAATAAEAPENFGLPAGLITATISGAADRDVVVGRDGRSYVINNNAWGANSSDGSQQLRYLGNSFEILRQTAGGTGDGAPASFPSIFIGANGATSGVNGGSTSGQDNLPIRVSDINTLPTTFNISGNMGDNNAAYDVWFAATQPNGAYDTAQSAFLMVWTHKPAQRNPIGTNNQAFQTGQTVAGVAGTWDLWVGRRGGNGPDANNPVINYVAPGTVRNFSADLNLFIQDAVARSGSGRLNGFTFSDQLFLTDVFAGFEIWGGGAGLRVDEFTAAVNP